MDERDQIWERVKKYFNYPTLSDPIFEEGEVLGSAHLNFITSEIKISEKFVDEVVEKSEMTIDEVIEAIEIHEVGHYMVYPKNLSTLILGAKIIDDLFQGTEDEPIEDNMRGFIFQTYADMVDDTSSVLDHNRRDQIINMRTASQLTLSDEFHQNVRSVMLSYLYNQASREYELKPELQKYHDEMKQIKFLDPETDKHPKEVNTYRINLFQFGTIITEMAKEFPPPKSPGGIGKGKEGKEGEEMGNGGGFSCGDDLDADKIIGEMSQGEVKKVLRELSKELSRGEYKQLKNYLRKKNGKVPKELNDEVKDLQIGTSKGELTVTQEAIQYYKELSRNFGLVVHKKPVETNKTTKTFEQTEKWRVGKDPILAMPNLSGNKYLPGITRSRKVSHRNIKSTDYDLPHLLVSIDSSGSMPNPLDTKSYSVLAAACAARSYHAHQSAIGVINFSGDSFYLPYTRDLDEALAGIIAYQAGGTTIDTEILKKMLKPEEYKLYEENPEYHLGRVPKEAIKKDINVSYSAFEKALDSSSIDLLMFTDGGIGNLDEVVELFEENAVLNRATIILTQSGYNFDMGIEESSRIRVHRVESEEDIPKMVIGDIIKNMTGD